MARLYSLWSCRAKLPRVATSHRVERSLLGRLRLVSQKISTSAFTRPEQAAHWMTAVQAQDFNAANWAIGLRAPGTTSTDVERSLASGKIVRSWPMRGTLHFLAAEDLLWILSLTSTRIVNAAKTRHAALGLTRAVISRAMSRGDSIRKIALMAP